MLNSHHLITVPPECGFTVWLYEKYRNMALTEQANIRQFIEDVTSSRKFETWGISKIEIEKVLLSQTFNSYSDLVSEIYYVYALKNNKRPLLIGDKNNYYIRKMGILKEIFKNPKFVFIVRDGRDVALSYQELHMKQIDSTYAPKLPHLIEDIAHEWTINNQQIVNASDQNSVLVTYESLVTNPKETLTEICSFLNVLYDDSMLQYHHNSDEPVDFLQWKSKVLESPDSNNILKFEKFMSMSDVSLFESIAGCMLKHFGYRLISKQ